MFINMVMVFCIFVFKRLIFLMFDLVFFKVVLVIINFVKVLVVFVMFMVYFWFNEGKFYIMLLWKVWFNLWVKVVILLIELLKVMKICDFCVLGNFV